MASVESLGAVVGSVYGDCDGAQRAGATFMQKGRHQQRPNAIRTQRRFDHDRQQFCRGLMFLFMRKERIGGSLQTARNQAWGLCIPPQKRGEQFAKPLCPYFYKQPANAGCRADVTEQRCVAVMSYSVIGELHRRSAKPTARLWERAVHDGQDVLAQACQKRARLTLNVQPGRLPCVLGSKGRDEQPVHAYARTRSSV